MMGSGVEYGQKVYTWLVKDQGIVKSDLYIRWTENPYFDNSNATGEIDENGQVWSGFSRIELAKINVEKSGNVFRKISGPAQIVKMEDFENISSYNELLSARPSCQT